MLANMPNILADIQASIPNILANITSVLGNIANVPANVPNIPAFFTVLTCKIPAHLSSADVIAHTFLAYSGTYLVHL